MTLLNEVSAVPPDGVPLAAQAVVDARDLRMRYGAFDVLRGIDLTARRGEVLTLLGPNGAGKPVTGLLHPLAWRA